jgi:sigma-B regulation protein RsbU (phosphoserine phosphatase)
VVECSRLKDAKVAGEKDNDLAFHASVPIVFHDQAVGIMNFAAEEWQLLSASDLQFLTTAAKQLGSALERAHLYDVKSNQHTSLESELEMARKVQVSLLPAEMPKIPGFSLAAFWQPAHGTSGDYYNVYRLPGGRWGLIIADVCGKGAPAALYMTMMHGLFHERVKNEASPAALLTQINRTLCERNMEMQFVTAFYAILEPEKATLKYAIAGHPPPFLRKAFGQVENLAGKGIALGISPEAEYDDLHLTLAPGDSLVAFTDGVTDATSPSSESYELLHLRTAISSAPSHAKALLKHVQNKLLEWVKEAPNYDDLTLLVLARKGDYK